MDDGFLNKLARRAAFYMPCYRVPLTNHVGVVSFSFDDVPHSACHEGREILEDTGVRGTFYVCGGLTDQYRNGQQYHSGSDLKDLHESGHEIGSQGFLHHCYQSFSVSERARDIEQNRAFLRGLGLPDAGLHFSYPYGTAGPAVKRHIRTEFASARSVWHGINRRHADLYLLRAVRLYDELWTKDRLSALIRENAETKGWLIFLTHGVRQNPGPFDCSPGILRHVVRESASRQLRVLTVGAALEFCGVPALSMSSLTNLD